MNTFTYKTSVSAINLLYLVVKTTNICCCLSVLFTILFQMNNDIFVSVIYDSFENYVKLTT